MAKKNIIYLSVGKREPDPRTMPVHTNQSYWVGVGYLGGLGGMKLLKRRRFLRIRSAQGICHYLLYTNPDKGKFYAFVSQFKRRVEITREQAEAHFKTKL